jgi:prepilin-type N-terminal cleavage/methylation domain-containing protein
VAFKLKRAFTILELIVVVTIVAVLVAILTPVFAKAKEAALVSQSTGNLKSAYISIELYRNDQDDANTYGSYTSMGLPTARSEPWVTEFYKLHPPLSPRAVSGDDMLQNHYVAPWLGFPDWSSYTLSEQGNAVLVIDPFFNDTRAPRKFLGIYLNGSVKWKFGKGEWMESRFWRQKESR